MKKLLALVVVVATILLVGRSARAANPTKAQCISANEEGDALKKRGSLRAARASFLKCTNAACPRLVRDDCNLRVTELEAAIPTITFTARDGAQDTTAVSVSMDGESLAKEVDGKPISVDPGEHTFTFVLAGSPPQTEKLVLREGEKNRQVLIQFGEAPKAEGATGRLVVVSGSGAAITIDGKPTAIGRFDGAVSAGSHEVKVSESGKITSTRTVEVKSGATETLDVTLEPEKRSIVPWVVGGAAVVVVAALVVGGVFLFSSDDKQVPPPQGTLGGVRMATFR
ncbi:MAG: PEGA domain-containing protein [Labilithrix sp.]|nr:PEGA domain-containing protein [Labilithrix sp.]MCW5809747.1 PEGA domain-containing protein [Labilithrix sp.]